MYNPFDTNTYVTGSAPKMLEWDEAAMDTQTDLEGFHDADRPAPKLVWLKVLVLVSCIGLGAKLFSLQVSQGQVFGALAEGNRLRSQTILAPRGIIEDTRGVPLAQNTASFNLVLIPIDLPKEGRDDIIKLLSATFSLNEDEVKQVVEKAKKNSFEPVIVKQDMTTQESILFETRAQEFPGFAIHSIPIRKYSNAEVFSHLIGYTSIISDTELVNKAEEHYEPNDFIGKYGLELSYEKYLRGVNGREQIEVDAKGRPVKAVGTIDPIPGDNVQLSIDSELQDQLYQAFKKNTNNTKGAAVAVNPKTGEVLALLSVPGFDNNLFAHGISSADYSKLTTDKNLPLFNRAITGVYPPGSTVKPMVALAALEYGIVDQSTIIVDRGVLVIPNQYDASQSYNFYGWKRSGLGPMNVKSAIAESSDIYFYTVTGGHPSSPIEGMGPERLADYYRKFQLGKALGIDLNGEKGGTVADPNWKANYFKDDKILSKWYLGDTYHIGIGQGDMLVTPLQVATWTAAIANNGVGYKPHVVKKVIDPDGKTVYEPQSETIIKDLGSSEHIRIVQEGMRQTVLAGSGRSLLTLPISSAGKTGTSQFDGADPTRTHAWYTAYAPYENPEIVITILVEAGGGGDSAAAPIVKQVLQWWADNRHHK
jgi:penicillin-binding protein 2